MIIITNLCIGITYLFSIILIIDELYNIGFFTFNYTYQYNYGSFISKFNNVQSIEYETNRFNVYNNINFLFKDIFNKSYFNYLLIIVATLITILCCIAYAVYFYFKFIIEQPQECSFDEDTNLSFPKQLLKCLCDECHKLIPNCTSNYFIVFILLIIVPLSYIFKTMFNINFTPNTDNALFGFLYICVFLLLIFYYSFNLFNRKTEYKYKDLVVYSLFTLIFISSGYIYKYILNKYNNINLNSSNDISTIYDIYKQTQPIKPKPIEKPLYKGKDLITLFKYNEGDKDPEYKIKKSIVDDYHKSIKTYDNDMKHYNARYNAYTNSLTSSKLGDKTNYFDIAINILGLNNYMHIYLIILIIISLVIYNIYNDDISYVCFIYVLTMLITLTIMNSILYYNTYINKYIIYEPMAHYKNDITNANTALNLELNPSSGLVFYNKLINNDKSLMIEPNSDIKDGKQILEDIKKLKDIKYYTFEITSNINTDITNYNDFGLNLLSSSTEDIKQINNAVFLYKKLNSDNTNIVNFSDADDPILYLIENCIDTIKSTSGNMKIESVKNFTFKYSKIDIKLKINMTNYYRYYYYTAYQYKFILEKIKEVSYNENLITINYLKDTINRIISLLEPYKEQEAAINSYMIDTNINTHITNLSIAFNISTLNSLKDKINDINNKIIKHIDITILTESVTAVKQIPLIGSQFAVLALKIKSDSNTDYTYSDHKNKYKYTNTNIDSLKHNGYFELPFKIIDDNDEYYLELKASKIMVYINHIIDKTAGDSEVNYNIKSKFKTGEQIKGVSYITPIITFHSPSPLTIFTASYSIPFIFYKNATNTSKINKFKKIILAVLFNSICNIQYKFTIQSFLDKIKNQKTTKEAVLEHGKPTIAAKYDKNNEYFIINKELTINYIDRFTQAFITDNYKKDSDMLIKAENKAVNFIILIFNSYYVSNKDIKKNISANIFNIINNSNDITDANSIIDIIELITKQEYFLEENINKDEKNIDEDINKLYNNNKSIINLIIILFENLFINIKKLITTNISSLCYETSVSLTTIENALLAYIDSSSSSTPATAKDAYSTIILSKPTMAAGTPEANSITIIEIYIRHYFNIVIFLLDNLKLNTNTAEIDAIMTNFNFYNRDDNVKSTIQKRLTISCDYYSKYNNMDSKQLSYFKINADNVNYNFPILMIIFLIILGEPIFIKS